MLVTTEGWGLESVLARAHDEGWQIVIIGSLANRDFWQGREGVEFTMADDLPLRYSQAMVCNLPTPALKRTLVAA